MVLLLTLPFKLLALDLLTLALTLFTLPVYHLLLTVSFEKFPLSGIALTFLVDRLRRRMLHCLADAWE
jgi:hypothetical protein